jgi:serine/threonine protein phosphatase 1
MRGEQKPIKNTRIYVIGDIHGRLDLLDRLIDAIHGDADEYSGVRLTVTLGDYIDRGPDSRGVIERLLANPFLGKYVALKGNHEALLETFLEDPAIGAQWRELGGLETLHSFGVPVVPLMVGRKYDQAAEQLRAALSTNHTKFLTSLETSLMAGRYFLCHAGIRPGVGTSERAGSFVDPRRISQQPNGFRQDNCTRPYTGRRTGGLT